MLTAPLNVLPNGHEDTKKSPQTPINGLISQGIAVIAALQLSVIFNISLSDFFYSSKYLITSKNKIRAMMSLKVTGSGVLVC